MEFRISELMQTIKNQDDRIKHLEAENANLKVENRSLIKSASMVIHDKGNYRSLDEARVSHGSSSFS